MPIKRFAIEILLLFCVLNGIKGQIRPTDPPPTPSDNPCLEPEGFFPIPGTCGSDYYVCVLGSPYIQTCPNGTIFDPEALLCLAPEEASCGPGATSRATTSTEAITTTAAIEETSETTTEMTTSSTTESTSPTTTTSTTTTQAGQFVCPPGAPAGNYPYPGDCTKYYSCTSDGRVFINTCPTNLWYSIEAEFCESKEIVAQERPECSLKKFTGRNVKPNIKKWSMLFDRIWSKLTA